MARRAKPANNATIIDVANLAGVSYATVSRVVNNKENVAPATRVRVLAAMEELGYQANLNARRLVSGRSYAIGLLVHNLMGPYIGEIMAGIDDVLATSNYELMLFTTHQRREREARYIDLMSSGMTDGLILILPRGLETYIRSLRQRHFPYVLVDHRGFEPTDLYVIAANWQGAYDATQHLLQLGHRRIGMITGVIDMDNARERVAGYQAALEAHQVHFDAELFVEGDYTQLSGVNGALKLLSLADPPTAIFASNDVMAFGVLEAAHACKLRVPQDLSLVGFDDVPMASWTQPRLTTVRQPLVEMGRLAAELLLRTLEDPEHQKQGIVVPAELFVRQSTAPANGGRGATVDVVNGAAAWAEAGSNVV
ncbi:MAG: LacI family DNA-binding transcriptional regulator [Anaerolineales bacterium]|nr:LacI family DNA-binding transcriptional regulator [Anaerolineales bacterium]